MKTEEYFERIEKETSRAYDVAEKARSQSKDPESQVDIPVAKDLAQKASSLVIAAKFPELEEQGVDERIRELEDEYGKNDERVSFEIAREIAEGEFYEFNDVERACDAGIRVGVSYMTGGITTAPLDGIGDIRVRENNDGTDYLAMYYAGPIRSAGGTASAMSVLLADYVRLNVGLDEFKPSDKVVDRYATEVDDYYNRVTSKQYYPDREETKMIAENVPVEVTGGPTEQIDVSNQKDLDRVKTNRIRGGMCLVYLDGLPLKAPKIKKRIEKWGKDFGLEHWKWIEEYLDLQEEIHSSDDSGGEEDNEGFSYTPSDKFLDSMTAGRPVFGHPGKKGGFRLRYGHSRTNGLAAVSVHPASMEITERFMAIGTQMKTEHPMKGTVTTPCDSVHPPIVKLDNGDVIKVETREKAREIEHDIDEILFLGDMLVPYGEFVENGKRLLPSPYVSEWWEKDLERALEETGVKLGRDFSKRDPTPEEAFKISEKLNIPLHPRWTYHWRETSVERFKVLVEAVNSGSLEGEKVKKCLEDMLIEHRVKDDGTIILGKQDAKVISRLLKDIDNTGVEEPDEIPQVIEQEKGFEMKAQAPHYVGARMGRPEKAEKRTLDGKPQLLFPCGKEEGGRMRNISESYRKGEVRTSIIHNKCQECSDYTYFSYCVECGSAAQPIWFCSDCGKEHKEEPEKCGSCGNDYFNRYRRTDIDVRKILDEALENLGERLPELLKSPRGMSGEHRHVEPVEKGILRQKYGLYVNKDGTVRYDATDLPMTHFKPREISASVEKLRELGYDKDIKGEKLESENQTLALKPQDIVIPDTDKSMPASSYFVNVANFIDNLLEELYGLDSYYNVRSKEDLIGELVIGLAPHTSGGTVGRIIGFTDAKGIYAHPYWHAGKRRNCDGDEDAILMLMDGLLNFSRQFLPDMVGAKSVTEDTRVFIKLNGEVKAPTISELVDGVVEQEGYEKRDDGFEVNRDFDDNIKALSFDKDTGEVGFEEVSALIRHVNDKDVYEVKTSRGELSVTGDHSVFITEGEDIKAIPVRELEEGDCVIVPSNPNISTEGLENQLDMFEILPDEECYVVVDRDERKDLTSKIEDVIDDKVKERYGSNNVYRYKTGRRTAPLSFYKDIGVVPSCKVRLKANAEPVNRYFEDCNELYRLLGYLLSEGALKTGNIYNTDKEIIDDVIWCIEKLTGVTPKLKRDEREDRKTCYFVRVPATFMRVLEQMGLDIKNTDEKSLPSFVFGADERKLEQFIEAYRRGDGSVYEKKGFSVLYTKSGEMATQLALLLRKLGYKTSTHIGEDTWQILYSEWRDKDPYWPLWSIKDEVRESLKDSGMSYEERKRFMSNYRKNSRMKTTSKEKIEDLYRDKNVESLEKVVEGSICVERVKEVNKIDYGDKYVYDLEVPGCQNFLCGPHPIFAHNTMDAPLILSTVLNPDEVDDEAWAVETVEEYPREFYEETQEYKYPWELETDIEIGEDIVHSDEPFCHGYTHESENIENGPTQSEYVTLDEMSEKTNQQLGLGRKLKSVKENKVADLLLQKHFIPDIKGNLRSFSEQEMRCVDCNTKYRRVPLTAQTIAPTGKTTAECPDCGGKILLTISEGTIKKYMEPSREIIENFEVSPYVRQQILILKDTLQSLFGKEERQTGIKQFA